MFSDYFFIKTVLCFLFLTAAGYQDIRTRTVPDSLWGKLLLLTFPILILETMKIGAEIGIGSGFQYIFQIFFSGLLMFVASTGLFYMKIFGGADAKALICLSLIFPVSFADIFSALNSIALATLLNSVLFVSFLPILFFLKNLFHLKNQNQTQKMNFDLLLCGIGFRTDIPKIIQKSKSGKDFYYLLLLERYDFSSPDPASTKKIRLQGIDFRDENETVYTCRLLESIQSGKISKSGWVTVGLPYLVWIAAGFVAALFFENLILKIILKIIVLF
ncbi:A24 family peptidase [Methanolapillus ohkumae]|uniref:A24 family peptidase n=1 Tax=Methanolapillus ohkumae TaxID=3028298 RepID=A0AA96V951_9EURY|nr:hypothetical protein MsAm2_13600 [Methanosarcinaceae archaeon Am2]